MRSGFDLGIEQGLNPLTKTLVLNQAEHDYPPSADGPNCSGLPSGLK
jgi:hypothetical protein